MKNKFKKSKIIVPALALITATTAASVTGTVAWFTATRAVTVTASDFVSTKLDSKLNVETTAGLGTTATTNKDGINITGKLTHGSYNAVTSATGSLYVAELDSDDETANPTITGYTDLKSITEESVKGATTTTDLWVAKADSTASNQIWYGVSWTMKFTLGAFPDNQTQYLLFDPTSTDFKSVTEDDDTKTGDTYKGLRIALMTDSKLLVVGGDDTKTHTKGTGKEDVEEFANTNYVVYSDTTAKLSDNNANLASSKFSFGELTADGITVTCVAWFEGSDSNVMNKVNDIDVVMSKVTATLGFYARYKTTNPTAGN